MSRALTLWPEWAWAIHNLDKRIENRDWAIPTGEWFALHAGKAVGGRQGAPAEMEGIEGLGYMAERAGWSLSFTGAVGKSWSIVFRRDNESTVAHDPRCEMERANPIRTSAIVGLFRVTRNDQPGRGDLEGWRVPDAVGNVLDYRPLTSPVPCKGAQGLWTVPPDVAALVRERVERREWAPGEVQNG